MSEREKAPHLAQVLSLLRWLLILTFVVLGYAVLKYLAHVLAPILAALGIAYMLNPVLEMLVRRGISRPIGAGILLIGFIGLLVTATRSGRPSSSRGPSRSTPSTWMPQSRCRRSTSGDRPGAISCQCSRCWCAAG